MTKSLNDMTIEELEVLWRTINGLNNQVELKSLYKALDEVYEAFTQKMGWEA
jgi:hypothetical protein